MKAYQLTKWQQPPELRDVDGARARPGRGAGQGRRRRRLPLRPSPDGVARRADGFRPPRSRSGTRTPDGSRRSAPESRASSSASRLRSTGRGAAGAAARCRARLENYCERAGGARRLRRRPRPRRRHGRVHAGPARAACCLPLGDLDPRDAAPLSDAALTPYHAVKRSLHLLVPGSTRGGHRRRRPRPHGRADPRAHSARRR